MIRKIAMTATVLGLGFISAQSSNPAADQISYIAQVQAALEASMSMHAKGDLENAKRLIGSGSGKRWDRVKADISSEDRKFFETGFKALNDSVDAKEPSAKYGDIIESLDGKLGKMIGDKVSLENAGVALDRMLIDTAFYYGVGVDAGKIVAPRTHALATNMSHEANEIAEKAGLGADILAAISTIQTKQEAVAPTEEIAALAKAARVAIGKATKQAPTELTNQLFLDRTRAGLQKADAEYAAGKVDQAVKTAAVFYLDGFEYLEAPLSAKNPEMKEAIEKMTGGELPTAMKAGKPAADVSKLIANALTELGKAAALLGLK